MDRAFARASLLAGLVVTASLLSAEVARSTSGEVTISQRDKQFQPGSVAVEAGQPLVIVNDDGSTVHHAYVESETFNFDSGDQNPGMKTRIVFPAKGDFQVLCGIHPKMKLDVHVR